MPAHATYARLNILLAGSVLVAGAVLWLNAQRIREIFRLPPPPPARGMVLEWPVPVPRSETGPLFAPEKTAALKPENPLSAYRLAGTFFSYGEAAAGARSAIIDNMREHTQSLMAEQDTLEGYTIEAIERDRVILGKEGERAFLLLSFPDRTEQDSAPATTPAPAVPEVEGLRGPYGTQVGEYRWVLLRDSLMNYYHELLDDPERIAHIYISLKPDYSPEENILGYELDMVGEEAFFEAVGLRQGDIIRKVNSMNMTSQQRGEYFLREFVNERLSAIVLDIERDNQAQKLIYLVR